MIENTKFTFTSYGKEYSIEHDPNRGLEDLVDVFQKICLMLGHPMHGKVVDIVEEE